MPDDGDMLELGGRRIALTRGDSTAASAQRKFLSVWFRCCHVYGRMTRNREESGYVGRCPKCAAEVRATIGQGGTTRRVFEAR